MRMLAGHGPHECRRAEGRRPRTAARRWLVLWACALLPACGGGGTSGPVGPQVVATRFAQLVSGLDSGPRAAVRLRLDSEHRLTFDVLGQPGWGPTATTCALLRHPSGAPPQLVTDLFGAVALLPAQRPVRAT